MKVCREAVVSWLMKLNTNRTTNPGDVGLYPSKADLETEMVNQGHGTNVTQETVRNMRKLNQLVFMKFPEGVRKRGRGEYIELGSGVMTGEKFEPLYS